MKKITTIVISLFIFAAVIIGCQDTATVNTEATQPNITATPTASATVIATPSAEPTLSDVPTPTLPPITQAPTATVKPTAKPTAKATPAPAPTVPPVNTIGNSGSNIYNRNGFVAQQGDWIFYIVNFNLYKLNRKTGSKTNIYPNANIQHLNVLGDWIYFTETVSKDAAHPEKGYFYYIRKIHIDGTQLITIAQMQATFLQVEQDWMYFVNGDTTSTKYKQVYKMKTDGTQQSVLVNTPVSKSVVYNGWFYYIKSLDANKGLYKINTDASQQSEIMRASIIDYVIQEDMIIYSTEEGMFVTNLNGGNKQKLSDRVGTSLHIQYGWLYFSDCYQSLQAYRLNINSKQEYKLDGCTSYHMNVIYDWIYFQPADTMKDDDLYRIHTDGTGKELVEVIK